MTEDKDDHALAEAARQSRIELEKQGTPEYDPRSHMRLVEAQRKAQEHGTEDADT
jgi:hypothetical protein